MQRTKVFAIVAAVLMAAAAALMFAGGASAASWHTYQGDMFAGHAYGLQVPAGAESIEFNYDGPEGGIASIGVYDPSGERVGHYALSPELTTASVANPAAGQYAVYVYDISEGGLTVRVASEDEPALKLATVPLAREETKIGTFASGKLDQVITADLARAPVFVTLLYEGSSRNLDATVASEKGDVVTITDESATAFSPGVWTTLKGERTFDASNLDGALYAIEVHADDFEGTMVLTSLALQLPKAPQPAVPPVPAQPPTPPTMPAATPIVEGSPAVFTLPAGAAIAFQAPAGILQLVDPAQLDREAAEEEGEEYDYGDDCDPTHAFITLYAPDDSVLAVITLTHDEPVAEIELPVAGEYVAYTHHAERDVVLANLAGSMSAPAVRELELGEEAFDFTASTFLSGQTTEFDLANVPVMLELSWSGGIGALANAYVESENGFVAGTDGPVVLGGSPLWFGTYQDPASFAKGLHMLSVNGFYEGSLRFVSIHYLRDSEVVEPPTHGEHEHDHDHDEEDEERVAPIHPLAPAALPVPDVDLPL